jgi:hypothetical protein
VRRDSIPHVGAPTPKEPVVEWAGGGVLKSTLTDTSKSLCDAMSFVVMERLGPEVPRVERPTREAQRSVGEGRAPVPTLTRQTSSLPPMTRIMSAPARVGQPTSPGRAG